MVYGYMRLLMCGQIQTGQALTLVFSSVLSVLVCIGTLAHIFHAFGLWTSTSGRESVYLRRCIFVERNLVAMFGYLFSSDVVDKRLEVFTSRFMTK